MKDFLKNKLVTALIVIGTVILAGVAIFTAIRLYQLRTRPVAPTAPESTPAASEEEEPQACQQLAFTLTLPSNTPTPTQIALATVTPTPPILPQAGVTFPTLILISASLLLIIFALVIAL